MPHKLRSLEDPFVETEPAKPALLNTIRESLVQTIRILEAESGRSSRPRAAQLEIAIAHLKLAAEELETSRAKNSD